MEERTIVKIILSFLLGFFFILTVLVLCEEEDFSPNIENTIALKPVIVEVPVNDLSKVHIKSLGKYTITAYCGCKKCCGKYSKAIPTTASGTKCESDNTVASPMKFGTRLYVDGLGTYTVEDRTANFIVDRYNGKIVDIYFDTHEEAKKFGKQVREVYKIEVKDE